jgi:hypothetical protein
MAVFFLETISSKSTTNHSSNKELKMLYQVSNAFAAQTATANVQPIVIALFLVGIVISSLIAFKLAKS